MRQDTLHNSRSDAILSKRPHLRRTLGKTFQIMQIQNVLPKRRNTMKLEYEGQCKRIDLKFRSKYPYLTTAIYKISDYNFTILIKEQIKDFGEISRDFNNTIRYVTVPINLSITKPDVFQNEIYGITDKEIPAKYEGMPFTLYQLSNHIVCTHPQISLSEINEDHENQKIIVKLQGNSNQNEKIALQITLDNLKMPYTFEIKDNGEKEIDIQRKDEIFNILSSTSNKHLNWPFLERDENLWFQNIDMIYSGDFLKSDLYFYDAKKSSCLVNFSKFSNANIRNHLLLYDVIYCILPLANGMNSFFVHQKISRDEFLFLTESGRVKILNMQPEARLDVGFIREIYQTNNESVVNRRAIAALCAIDIVEMNDTYILNEPEISKNIFNLLLELSELMKLPTKLVSDLLYWPKIALRSSFETLSNSGPMAISRYGVNNTITNLLGISNNNKELEFEFTVNSDQIHLAHALNATYFPFFIDNSKYSDHPYALLMGNMLNFYKTFNHKNVHETIEQFSLKAQGNPSIQLVNTFDIDDYISIQDFEKEISSEVIRNNLKSLFTELSELDENERQNRIEEFNKDLEKAIKKRKFEKHALDLGEDLVGLVIPFLNTGKKLVKSGTRKAMDKLPALQQVSDYIESKSSEIGKDKGRISLLTKINRVARLKKRFE